MANQLCIVLDFGGQYNQLIARRVRECGVYCEIKKYDTPIEEIKALNPMGIIFTGGPNSVYDETSPHISKDIFEIGVPILGICYGCQLMAYTLGGTVESCEKSEYGKIERSHNGKSLLLKDIPEKNIFVHNDVKRVSLYMKKADLAVTSQGRTIYELASMGVPAIVLAQNEREAQHVFAGIQNGFINLGIGKRTDDETVIQTMRWLIETPNVRKEMRNIELTNEFRMGQKRVIDIILKERS